MFNDIIIVFEPNDIKWYECYNLEPKLLQCVPDVMELIVLSIFIAQCLF